MFNKLTTKMSPETIRNIKIGAVLVGAIAATVVVGVVLYKTGLIGEGLETVEELTEAAVQTA